MGWQNNRLRCLVSTTPVRLGSLEGVVATGLYAGPPHGYVPVLFNDLDYVALIHFEALEVFESDPPAKRYEETLYYQETSTGALYKRQRSDHQLDDHFICIGAMKPSVTVLAGDTPVGFKRLYKEV